MHKQLIKKIIESGKPEDMVCLEEILVELIDNLKITDREEYEQIEFKLYRTVYGEHLNEELAKKWVSKMENKDGTTGGHWTLEQTNQFAGAHNKYDWYAVLNMMYSDYYNSKFDINTYVELANDWIDDKDVGDGKTLKYYMFVAC